jgi:hypothetical protein
MRRHPGTNRVLIRVNLAELVTCLSLQVSDWLLRDRGTHRCPEVHVRYG